MRVYTSCFIVDFSSRLALLPPSGKERKQAPKLIAGQFSLSLSGGSITIKGIPDKIKFSLRAPFGFRFSTFASSYVQHRTA